MLNYYKISKIFAHDGGKGSGNFGHKGRKGKVGGSSQTNVFTGKYENKTAHEYINESVIKEPQKHSLGAYINKNGRINKERHIKHAEIINDFFKGRKRTTNPVIYFNGGGSASGKSTAIGKLFPEIPSQKNRNGIVVDSDEIKKKLPEYVEKVKAGETNAASFAHEESSALSKLLFEIAVNTNEYNVLMDATLAGNPENVKKKILRAKASGNPVIGNFVTVDIDEALKRNYKRFLRTGRMPDVVTVIKNHKEVSNNYQQVVGLFDNSTLIDNNGKEPVIIAKSGKDGKLQILDKEKYNKFINKVNQSEDEIKARYVKNLPKYKAEFFRENMKK